MIDRLAPYLLRHRRGLVWGSVCVAVANVIALAQPQVLRLAVDDLYTGVTAQKLGRYAIILFVIALVAGVFRYWMRQVVIGISRHIEFDLRNDLFAHLQRLPLGYFQHTRTGELMSRATNDLAAVRMMLGPGFMYLVNTAVVAVVAIACMVAISPRMTFYAMLPLPLVTFSVWFFGERIHRGFEAIQASFAALSAHVQENLAGVRVVRAHAREGREMAAFGVLQQDYLDRNQALIKTSGLFHPALAFLSGLAALLGLYLGGREVMKGRITLGAFVAFTTYLAMLNWPVYALGWVISLFQRGMASFRRILEILDVTPAIVSPPDAVRPADCRGALEIRHLTFTYPGATRPALRDVSLSVPAGKTVAIVGRTGSGKSTLLSLLPRVFDPPAGSVVLDGRDVRTLDVAWLRRRIAVVPQDPFLFSATIGENIAYGVESSTPEDVARVASLAHLDPDLSSLPQRLDTPVGERGVTLSGGQKQRVTIARALLRDSPVLLLDDCLSSVDALTEEAVLDGLRGEMLRRTTLIVAHRLSTVRDADWIVVLEDGRVVEQGAHATLTARGGAYTELVREQQIEAELEAS